MELRDRCQVVLVFLHAFLWSLGVAMTSATLTVRKFASFLAQKFAVAFAIWDLREGIILGVRILVLRHCWLAAIGSCPHLHWASCSKPLSLLRQAAVVVQAQLRRSPVDPIVEEMRSEMKPEELTRELLRARLRYRIRTGRVFSSSS